MSYENYSCSNENCEMYGKREGGNIAHRCWYGKAKDRELLYCKACGVRFSAERYTTFGHTKLSKDKFCEVLECLCNKAGIRGTARITGISTKTVLATIRIASQHLKQVNQVLVKDLKVSEVQMDEFWAFIKKKKKMQPNTRKNKG